jgi:PAS domain S-box-containing protein
MTETSVSRAQLRVLFVDDVAEDVELCAYELTKAGLSFEAATAATPAELSRLLKEGAWDVVLADYHMVGWSGMDALDLVKRHGTDIPFILVTGTLAEEGVIECIKRGAADYALKGKLTRLPLIVQRAVEQETLREERDRAQEGLREAEEKYRGIFENALEGIYQMSRDGRLVTANPMMAHIFGYGSAAELIAACHHHGRELYLQPEHRDEFLRILKQQGLVRDFESEVRRKDGTIIWVLESARALGRRSRGDVDFEGVIMDVSERKMLEAQLVRSQKIEAVGQLAAGVAHDFNNLLGVITGYAELLRKELGRDDLRLMRVEHIQRAAARAADLTRQLLAFSRQQVLQPSVLDLNAVVGNVEGMLRRLISENVQIVTVLETDLGRVRVDPGQVEQIIINLAVNARDAMPRGGKLIIETGNVDLDESYVRSHPGAREGPHVLLAVSDTGTGMDANTLSHIFEPFFTTKELGKGTGLGLATVYGIVKQSGAYIQAYSEPGRGTTFRVYLPRVQQETEVAPSLTTEPARGGEETILLAEDEESLRLIVREMLQEAGYTVLDAKDPEGALRVARDHPGPIHLVVTDVVMPGISGRELAESLEARRPGIAVLYMSGYTDEAIAHQGVLAEGVQFLEKPFTTESLLRKVRLVLDERKDATSA